MADPEEADTNPRGIPRALFIEDVPSFLASLPNTEPDYALKLLQENLAKYKFMDQNSRAKRESLEEKVPELRRSLEMVEVLQAKAEAEETLETTFELSDTLYARGEVSSVEQVYVWLGANTMLSYPLPQAHELLTGKLNAATIALKNTKEDILWLRDQITVTEVNVARVYNHDVKLRRERREKEGAGGDEEE